MNRTDRKYQEMFVRCDHLNEEMERLVLFWNDACRYFGTGIEEDLT